MKTILATLALPAAPLASPVAFAQSDGILGKSSTGTLNFNVKISDANRIQIFGFGDIVQTVEAEKTELQTRGNGPLGSTVGTGVPGAAIPHPCITADLPNTTVTLDWSITPLADGSNIVPFNFFAVQGVGRTVEAITPFYSDNTLPQSGSYAGFPARQASTLSPNLRDTCGLSSDSAGKLSFTIGHSFGQTINTPGTYVSTVTFTVKPE
ncbi:MAG: hypothetical protein ACE37M_03375 [Henriciella sp.]